MMPPENDDALLMERLLAENEMLAYKWIDVHEIPIDPEVRKLCEQNACGHYGRNHMCPPGVEDISVWKAAIRAFTQALLVSKAYPTIDSFDLEGMSAGASDFGKRLRRIRSAFHEQWPGRAILLLGAGPCRYCKPCAYADGQPCRFPEEAFPSVEACGVDVVTLTRTAGMQYYNGKNTVTYFGMILFR